ncbi:MAG: glycine betaine transporter substrate-binding protein [Frankiales bacterium]|nr:glycine betaine transporter substrate-binding protein [Frankiales bacterium]
MPLPRRATAPVALTLLAVLGLTGCVESGRTSTAAAPAGGACPVAPDPSIITTARIAYQHIPNADLVVKDRGILEACMPKATITWSKFESGGDVIQAFGAKSVDLGLIGSSPATKALSAPLNIPVQVVWVHDVIGEAESLVARDPAVKDLAGLKGGTIAVPFSSTAHYSLLQALQDAGMDSSKDVKLVNLAPENMPSAWKGGQIDAAWVWDPVQSALKAQGGHLVLSSADTAKAGKPTYDLGAATQAFVGANDPFMKMWARAEDEGVRLITEKPDEAAQNISAVLGIPPADVQKQFPGYHFLRATEQASPAYLGGKMATDLRQTAGFLLQQGGITAISAPAVYAGGVDAAPAASVSS